MASASYTIVQEDYCMYSYRLQDNSLSWRTCFADEANVVSVQASLEKNSTTDLFVVVSDEIQREEKLIGLNSDTGKAQWTMPIDVPLSWTVAPQAEFIALKGGDGIQIFDTSNGNLISQTEVTYHTEAFIKASSNYLVDFPYMWYEVDSTRLTEIAALNENILSCLPSDDGWVLITTSNAIKGMNAEGDVKWTIKETAISTVATKYDFWALLSDKLVQGNIETGKIQSTFHLDVPPLSFSLGDSNGSFVVGYAGSVPRYDVYIQGVKTDTLQSEDIGMACFPDLSYCAVVSSDCGVANSLCSKTYPLS